MDYECFVVVTMFVIAIQNGAQAKLLIGITFRFFIRMRKMKLPLYNKLFQVNYLF